MSLLNIDTEIRLATELLNREYDDAEERVIDLCLAVDGTNYFNPRDGVEKGLYRASNFQKQRLGLYKQIYEHPVYPQVHGPFISHMSVLDLLFNCGPVSLEILRSGLSWEKQ